MFRVQCQRVIRTSPNTKHIFFAQLTILYLRRLITVVQILPLPSYINYGLTVDIILRQHTTAFVRLLDQLPSVHSEQPGDTTSKWLSMQSATITKVYKKD